MTTTTAAPRGRTIRHWRVVDLVVASVLAAACSAIFIAWNGLAVVPTEALKPLLPGVQGILNGPWLIAGPLAGLVVRKPGAALYAEFLAAAIELVIFPAYGVSTLLSGAVQGLGAEIAFAIVLYRVGGPLVALLAGALAGVGESVVDGTVWYPGASASFLAVYAVTTVVSGAVIGLVAYGLVRALAATGVLDRFPAGRARRRV